MCSISFICNVNISFICDWFICNVNMSFICSWLICDTTCHMEWLRSKIIGLFCKRALLKRLYPAKETYNFEELSNRSHSTTCNIPPTPWPCAFQLCVCVCVCVCVCNMTHICEKDCESRLVGSLILHVTFAKEPCKRDDTLQKRERLWAQRQPAIWVAGVCVTWLVHVCPTTYREPRDCMHFKWLGCHGKIDFKYPTYATARDPCVHVYTYRCICIWVSCWSHPPCVNRWFQIPDVRCRARSPRTCIHV